MSVGTYPVIGMLGFQWNFKEGTLRVTEDRMMRICTLLRHILDEVRKGKVMFSAKLIAKLSGQIISTKAVLGDQVRLRTRSIYSCIDARASWDSNVKLSADAVQEVRFWSQNIVRLNVSGADMKSLDISDVCDFELFSDASDIGFGGYIVEKDNDNTRQAGLVFPRQQGPGDALQEGQSIVNGSWSRIESTKSSTWRELESINRVLNR